MRNGLGIWVVMVVAAVVVVGSHAMAGAPGDGIQLGQVTLRPYADVSVLYDDNVQVAPNNELDDTSLIGKLGLKLDTRTDVFSCNADFWGLAEKYSDLDGEDHEDFGDKISISIGRQEGIVFGLQQTYASLDSLDYGTGQIEERDVLTGSGNLTVPLTDKMGARIEVAARNTDYSNAGYFDWDRQSGTLELAHKVTDKTSLAAVGVVGMQSSDALSEDTDFYKARLAVKSARTAKVSGRAGIGFQEYSTGNNDMSGVSYLVAMVWHSSQKIALQVGAENGVEPGVLSTERSNNKDVSSISIAAEWKATDSVSATLRGDFLRAEFDRQVDGRSKDEDTTVATLRVDYASPAKFLKLYALAKMTERDSTFNENDFTQAQAQLGVQLQY